MIEKGADIDIKNHEGDSFRDLIIKESVAVEKSALIPINFSTSDLIDDFEHALAVLGENWKF